MPEDDFRPRLVAERTRLGLTQAEAARKAGMTRNAWWQLEEKTEDPRLTTIEKLVHIGMKLSNLSPLLAKHE